MWEALDVAAMRKGDFSYAAYLASLLQERIVRELDLPKYGYRVDAKDPAFFSPYPDGRHLFMWQDRRKTLAEIAKFSKRDAERYPAYEDHLERLSQVVEGLLLTAPPPFPLVSPKMAPPPDPSARGLVTDPYVGAPKTAMPP